MTDKSTDPESYDYYIGKREGIFLVPGKSKEMKRFSIEEAHEFLGCDDPLITHLIVFKPYNVYENEMPEFIHMTALTDPLTLEKYVYQEGDVTDCDASAFAPKGFARNALPVLFGKTVFVGKKFDAQLYKKPFGQDVKDLWDLLEREGEEKMTVPHNVIPIFRTDSLEKSTTFEGHPGIDGGTWMFWCKQ